MNDENLQSRAILEAQAHGSIRAAARAWKVSHGIIARAVHGGNSPTLRRLWGIRKSNRTRLNIDTTPALITRFDTQRGDMSRGEYLERLLSLEWRL